MINIFKLKKDTFTSRSKDSRFIRLSESNKKLIPNKDTKFLIWNVPARVTCPYATEHCKAACYAVKSERAYPSVLPSRKMHFIESLKHDFVVRMIYTIESYLLKPSYKSAKRIIIRIHESGDFYNLEYMNKWYYIAEYFKYDKRIIFMAYTKSVVFVDKLATLLNRYKPDNMVVRFSIWDDTPQYQIDLANKYNLPIYTAVDKFNDDIQLVNRCLCVDCATCNKCWSNIHTLICEIH